MSSTTTCVISPPKVFNLYIELRLSKINILDLFKDSMCFVVGEGSLVCLWSNGALEILLGTVYIESLLVILSGLNWGLLLARQAPYHPI